MVTDMADRCGDNRLSVIASALADLVSNTNIEDSPEEMKVLRSFLFRCWQMGWLRDYDPVAIKEDVLDTIALLKEDLEAGEFDKLSAEELTDIVLEEYSYS